MSIDSSLETEIIDAIGASRFNCSDPVWNDWADRWCAGEDRSSESACRAARAARLASGRPNDEDLDEIYPSPGLDSPDHELLWRDVLEMEYRLLELRSGPALYADREAEYSKRGMDAAELAAWAAALAAGASSGSPVVAERIAPFALFQARQARRLLEDD